LFIASFAPRYRQQADEFAKRKRKAGKIVEMRGFGVDIQEGNPKTKIVTRWKKSEGISVWIKVREKK
jgi:hypothetical protein